METGNTTNFENLQMFIRDTNSGVMVDKIDAVIPAMGKLTGDGTISPDDELNFRLLMIGVKAKGIGKVGVGIMSMFSGSSGPTSVQYGNEKFTDIAETNSYRCPEGKPLTYVGIHVRNRTQVYVATRKRCRDCRQKAQCTTGRYRQIAIHVHEVVRQRARERTRMPAFAAAQRQRRRVETLFAELKNQIGLRRLRLRRLKFVREQFLLAATAQNLKRLVQYLRMRSLPAAPAS